MRYQFDRERCGDCGHVNRPPRQWPVFAFCPYCGRDLSKSNDFKENKGEHGDMENKYKWTDEADEIVRTMMREGAYKEDICDRMGITDKQLSNRLCVLRSRGEELPRLRSSGRIPCEGSCNGACEACEKLDEVSAEELTDEPEEEHPETIKPTTRAGDADLIRMIEEREIRLKEKEVTILTQGKMIHEQECRIKAQQEEIETLMLKNEMTANRITRLEAAIDRKNRTIAALSEELYGEED
jgi:hypothetical protein